MRQSGFEGPHICIVIPTTCEERRKEGLFRAIGSIREQHGVKADVVLVVNGTRYSPELLAQFRSDPDLTVHYREEGNLPAALQYGVSQLSCDFFGFLDDDDMLLPLSVRQRVDALLAHPEVDVVAGNGFISGDRKSVENPERVNANPLAALLEKNWCLSCACLFRASSVGEQFFAGNYSYQEWTCIAAKLIAGNRKILFLDVPTYRIFDTPGSASKHRNANSVVSAVQLSEEMLVLPHPGALNGPLKQRLISHLHEAADYFLSVGALAEAWRYHWKSLRAGGYRYALFTRHLLHLWITGRPPQPG